MAITQDFRSIPLDKLIDTCKERKNEGYRLAQLCPKLERDDSITLIYTFVKESEMINYKVSGIKKGVTEVPSVTELFIAAFVFENEAHDLFGVNVVGNLIDFQGKFYSFAEGVEAPMTIVTPAQLAAREKAAKLAAARAAKAKQKDAKPSAQSDEELDAKLSTMDPEKAAKVRAAMKAKAAKAAKTAASSSANDLEDKLAGMDPEKAAKVRAAMEAKAKRQAETAAKEGE